MSDARARAQQAAHERGAFRISLLLALLLHAAVAFTLRAHVPERSSLLVTEVDLVPEPPPAPAPPAPPAPPPSPAAVAPKPPIARAPARPPAPPSPRAPAPAPALLTAGEDAQPSDEPVRFATDPNARGVSYGLVARGGTAAPSSEPAAAAPPASPSPRIVPNDQLSRQPTLVGVDCRGYFPQHSVHDLGQVSVIALIEPSGAIARLELESETPPGQGFARAARACLARQRFTPALDKLGRPALARTRVSIRFAR